MVLKWLKSKLLPKKQSDDPTVKEITHDISLESTKLKKAITKLDKEVDSMQKERNAMNSMLDEAVALIARRGK